MHLYSKQADQIFPGNAIQAPHPNQHIHDLDEPMGLLLYPRLKMQKKNIPRTPKKATES